MFTNPHDAKNTESVGILRYLSLDLSPFVINDLTSAVPNKASKFLSKYTGKRIACFYFWSSRNKMKVNENGT